METYINIDDLGGIPITLDTFINNIYIYTYSIIIILLLLRIIRRYNIYICIYSCLFVVPLPVLVRCSSSSGSPPFAKMNRQAMLKTLVGWWVHTVILCNIYIYTHLDRDIHITYYIFITYWGVSSSINWESLSEPSVVFHGFWHFGVWSFERSDDIQKPPRFIIFFPRTAIQESRKVTILLIVCLIVSQVYIPLYYLYIYNIYIYIFIYIYI